MQTRHAMIHCCRWLLLALVCWAQQAAAADEPQHPSTTVAADPAAGAAELAAPGQIDWSVDAASAGESQPMRITLAHEDALRLDDADLVNHRSWFRLEYARHFLDSFFAQLDTKLNAFWGNDHRARAEDRHLLLESHTQEAFLQYSPVGSDTSVRAGVQRLIWGESEGGAITDEVSPRNLSELFFIPLEESRIGQFMFNLDHFSDSGDWSLFFVPRPKFNKYPRPGTAYHVEAFERAVIRDETGDSEYEYGMRWKKTFGKSDIALMAASLIDNDYVFRMDGATGSGDPVFSRLAQRFTLAGVAFNYVNGKFLFKGEMAIKSSKAFNDSESRLVEKDVVDGAFGITYALGQSDTIGIEFVNSHVRGWDGQLAGVRRNSGSWILNANFFFLNDTLTVNWLTIYGRPFESHQSSLRTSYKWSDNTTLHVDAHLIDVPDANSPLWPYRKQDQVFFRIQYQF
ncbi:hypothetical protein N8I74_03745 [Chitiniphilus purpureus]|uniref:Porin n=1 Tax=Chitiniphilus purpureus TaxID=2981137 RepID=A0ABY6DQ38_9NEIS|nr:hypothetical protein [Chitiniphilus sp. CD1]UXY16142.1 hypothetical protein N8I74_03745 [Chitiniphilus sp. CD1]